MKHLRRKRSEAGFVRYYLAGKRQRHHRPAMKAARKRDNSVAPGKLPRDLNRVLNGLGARCQEDGFLGRIARRDVVDACRECDIHVVGRDLETGVAETLQLGSDGGDDSGMIVARIANGDAGSKIDVTASLYIPELGVACLVSEYPGLYANTSRCGRVTDGLQLLVRRHIFPYTGSASFGQAAADVLGYDARLV